MIVGNVRATQLEWREPEDEQVVERHPAPTISPSPEAPSAPPSAAHERSAAPLPRNLLDTLPAAAVQPPPSAPPAPPAAAPGPAVPVTAPPAAQSIPTPAYVSERPVDAAWLAARETTLVAVRADYEAARAKAQANGGTGTGPGWAATFVTDESGQVSQQLEFNEEAFAASYRAQGGAPLQALAAQYGTDAATLLAQHPDLWAIATHDHALNAGPAPAEHAMGNASQLGMLDLYLADPQIASLSTAYGGTAAPATGGIAQEQVRIYGQQRYDQLSRLGNAMASVRTQYSTALAEGLRSGTGPGWVESESPTYATDESGQQIGAPIGTTTVRNFDPDAFTAWYNKQDGLQNKAFFDFYGASHTSFTTDESGHSVPGSVTFDNPNWSLYQVSGVGYPMTHRELVGLDPNSPPDLNNDQAVGFDLEAGWATSQSNIHQDTDWFEIAFKVVIVAAVSYFSAGTLGPEVAGAIGVTSEVGVAVVSAAVAGAASSTVSGVMNDNLTFKGILQGALAGALTAGLTGPGSSLGNAARSAGPAATIALRTTVQGGIQALLGGSFKDGAIAGFASGLAAVAGASIGSGIDKAVKEGTMNAAEAIAARSLARVFTSAVQALGNPNDPNYGFASALVNDVVGQAMQPGQPAPTAGTTTPATAPAAPAPEAAPAPAAQTPPAAEVALMTPPGAPEQPEASAPVPSPAPGGADEAASPGAQTFPVGGPGSVAFPPQGSRETRRDGRLIEFVQYDDAGQIAASYRAPDANGYTLTLGNDHALVRTDSGELRLASLAEMQANALNVVVGPGQSLVSGGERQLVLPAGASPELVSAASAMTVAFGQRAVLGALADAAITSGGRALTPVLEIAMEGLPRLLGAVGLLLVPGNPGPGTTTQDLSPDVRLVTRQSDVLGKVEFRVTDERGNEQWVRVRGQFDQLQAQQLAAALRTSMLSPEEIARALAPITTPLLPPPRGPTLITTPAPTDGQRPQPLPGYEGQPPAGPTTTTTPIEPQTWEDLITESRQRADDAWRANPNLRSPGSLIGTGEGGPGEWGYSPTRTGGEAYQEQITNVPEAWSTESTVYGSMATIQAAMC